MTSKDRLLALGLMSGTSCDGVDAALVETDGREAITCGPWLGEPYDAAFHDRLRSVLGGRGEDHGVNVFAFQQFLKTWKK
jgi:1,6-anhydro-N-acetylmuramate kinase